MTPEDVARKHERDMTNLKGAFEFGAQALKSIELLNGGAVLALLTFYGSILKDAKPAHLDKKALTLALMSYAVGLCLGLFAALLAYFSQLQSATARNGGSEVAWRVAAVVLAILAALAFPLGTWFAVQAFVST
jgi:hypothetical protein